MEKTTMALAILGQNKEVSVFDLNLDGIIDTYKEIQAAQQEVGGTVIYRAKVAPGGIKSFSITTGDEDNDFSVPSFAGIIIHNHKCNARFDEDSTSNSNMPPICSSIDGITGIDVSTGEIHSCAACPHNVYGTAAKGRGKSCKNMICLYILTEGSPIPIKLMLPPTSIKDFQNYRLSTLAAKKLKPQGVVTEFNISIQTSATGNKYGVVKYKLLGKLSPDMERIASYFSTSFSVPKVIEGDDYTCSEQTEKQKISIEVDAPMLMDEPNFGNEDDTPF